ncbi:hypothetical protein FIV38_28175 [Pseudomonas proteolytica]|nr:hypothetical protein F4W61_27455 [Pseudomonas proteolytica]TWR72554.1 hypothetical protein FIV38_28175 [Pseudomonas proteolytica]
MRACSRRRRFSQLMCLLTHRLREQARSHIWIVFTGRNRYLLPLTCWYSASAFALVTGTHGRM